MKSLSCLVFGLILLPLIAFSQKGKTDTLSPMLFLRNGTLLKQHEFEVESGLFGNRFFDSTGDKIAIKDIKFYQSKEARYGYYSKKATIRQETGTFDLYFLSGTTGYYSGNRYMHGSPSKYFYAKGFGDLRELKYRNLKSDLGVLPNNEFPEEEKIILDFLEKGKKRKLTKQVIIWTGISALIAGTILAESPGDNFWTSKKAGLKGGYWLGIAGVGISGVSILMPSEHKFYLEALRAYNKVY